MHTNQRRCTGKIQNVWTLKFITFIVLKVIGVGRFRILGGLGGGGGGGGQGGTKFPAGT